MKEDETGLKLKVSDAEDLHVVAGLMQDALVEPRAMRFWNDDQRFVGLFYRFCWEDCAPDTAPDDKTSAYVNADANSDTDTDTDCAYSRRHTTIIFDQVKAVQVRGIDFDSAVPLELLDIQFCDQSDKPEEQGQHIKLIFADDKALRLHINRLVAAMEDVGARAPTRFRPCHDNNDTAGTQSLS